MADVTGTSTIATEFSQTVDGNVGFILDSSVATDFTATADGNVGFISGSSVTVDFTQTATGVVSLTTGESYCNTEASFSTASLDVAIDPQAISGGGRVEAPMQTISFTMRAPFLMQGQPYHPSGPTTIATTTTGTGTVIAPVEPEVYTTVDVTDTSGNSSAVVQPTQRWIVKDSSISGGQNGGVQFNYVTTWTPESGNTAWNFTSPGFPYRPYFGDFDFASGRPYSVSWPKTLAFAGRYDEFMQLDQTISQPSTFMLICWQVKLNGTASSYPIFNRYPIDVSPYAFPATVDPDWGYRIFERGDMEMVVGNNADVFTGGKDFAREAIYTFVWDGTSSKYRYKDHDRVRVRSTTGSGASTPGLIIGGSSDVNYFLVVPEVLYFNSALDDANIERWEENLYTNYDIGRLTKL